MNNQQRTIHLALQFAHRLADRAWTEAATLLTLTAQQTLVPALLQASWERIILPDWGLVHLASMDDPDAQPALQPFVDAADDLVTGVWIYVPLSGDVHVWSEAVTVRVVQDGPLLAIAEVEWGRP